MLLNVFAFGFLIGRTRFGPPSTPLRPGEAVRLDLRAIGKVLPRDKRRALRRALAERREELQHRLAALRAVQREVDAALTAEPFDPARLDAAFARLRTASAAIQEPVQRTMVIFAERLDRRQRRELAEHLARMRYRWHEDAEHARENMLRRLDALKERARELARRRQEVDARLKTAGTDAGTRTLREALNTIEREEARLMTHIERIEHRLARSGKRLTIEVETREHEDEDDDDSH